MDDRDQECEQVAAMPTGQPDGEMQMSARRAIMDRAKRLREEACGLEQLARDLDPAIRPPLSAEAEQSLWRLVITSPLAPGR